ncbi:ATP-binding protein [Moraxellaceae bacterium AER2_44_116]|nr:ATP-binding protein [Moraxellaceae bacterium AER2_44_116]
MLFQTWKALKTPNTEFRLCLAWGEPVANDITRVLELQPAQLSSFDPFPTKIFKIKLDQLWEKNPEKFNRWDSLSRYVRDNHINRDEFNDFCNDLIIEVCLPKASLKFETPNDLENILIEQSQRLGIEQYPNDDIYINDFLVRLAKNVGRYRTRSLKISVKDILKELRLRTDFGKINQKFEIDQSKNIDLDESYISFDRLFLSNKKNLLIGEPGAGKSWFLTNFIEHLEKNNRTVIRHYCFTNTEDEFVAQRVSSNVFFGNLIHAIMEKFPKLKSKKNQIYAANLNELNLLLEDLKEPLVIIVDGLDHINRVLNSSATLSVEKTRILEYISQIKAPENISIILGSQPIEEVKFLITDFQYQEVKIPKWDIVYTNELMEKFGCSKALSDNMRNVIHAKSEGNPLYLTYILMTINNSDNATEQLIESLPQYDFNLKRYYEYLTQQIENNITAEILSCLNFAVTRVELKEIIPVRHHFDSNMKKLSPVLTENTLRGGIRLYHDSFRRFNMEKLASLAALNNIYEYIVIWLENKGFYENDKTYRYLLNYLILSEKYQKVSEFANVQFLAESLYAGHSEHLIRNNYKNFLHVAEKLQNWPLFIYLSELNRAISTTNSEEHQSQFLENFELYFEAICSIYGADKANALLFFNGEKNFNLEVTAKAFRILQKYDYTPRWEEVKELFNTEISLENYKYFICYLISNHKDLNEYFYAILAKEYSDFFRVFVVEVFEKRGFDEIYSLYQKLDDKDNAIAIKINSILERLCCNRKINTCPNTQIYDLEKLDLSFADSYIRDDELNRFYFNLEKYAKLDIGALIDFERKIPTKNFFYNWIKYLIKTMIIDNKCTDTEEKERLTVENITFLASDTDRYKGQPRAIDFTYNNSSLLDHTIKKSLRYIVSIESWKEVITSLIKIPYPTLSIIESHFLNEKNIHYIIEAYEKFDHSDDENYIQHAEYAFKKSIYYGKVEKNDKAKQELKKALTLITTYTSHKDLTLEELIEPLSHINNIDPKFSKKYIKELKYLTDAVMKHTDDGKDTRWLTIQWFEEFLKIDYQLAAKYLITQLLNDEYFWKLDYMFVNYLQYSKNIDSIILNFLFKLSPTNTKNSYLNGFLGVIEDISKKDVSLAKLSLLNLSIRDWNNSYDHLENETLIKFYGLLSQFEIPIKIKSIKSENKIFTPESKKLNLFLTETLCNDFSLRAKTESELIEYYDKKDQLSENDINYLYFFLQENNNEETAISLLGLLSKIRFPRDPNRHFEQIRILIERTPLRNEAKIDLLTTNFVFSKDGWFSSFTDKESLRIATQINKNITLKILASHLCKHFTKSGYSRKSTANLIIAFEYCVIDKDYILSMYKTGFDFIKARLPDENNFKWDDVELLDMNDNELALILMLSKSRHLDAFIQREIIFSISYILDYDDSLLTKPFKWFFNNIDKFHQLTIASMLELFIMEVDLHPLLFKNIEDELRKACAIDNPHIHNLLLDIIGKINHDQSITNDDSK